MGLLLDSYIDGAGFLDKDNPTSFAVVLRFTAILVIAPVIAVSPFLFDITSDLWVCITTNETSTKLDWSTFDVRCVYIKTERIGLGFPSVDFTKLYC